MWLQKVKHAVDGRKPLTTVISCLRYSSSKSSRNDFTADEQFDGNPIQGFKSREHEFYGARSHDIMPRTAEELEKEGHGVKESRELKAEDKEQLEKYEKLSSVSLRSVMQSNVPEPFNPGGRNPTHLNMPGGGVKLEQKYVADYMQKVHPSRQFSTSAISLNQTAESIQVPMAYTDLPCPQGVQGYECVRFKLWLQNCQRHNLNCDQMIEDFHEGRKTLAQIFEEQEAIIEAVVMKNPRNSQLLVRHEDNQSQRFSIGNSSSNDNEAFLQGIQGSDYLPQRQHYSTSVGGSHEVSKDNLNPGSPPLTQRQKLKRAIKEYGSTVVVFHVGISLMSLGGFYLAVSSGIDMVDILGRIGVGQSILESKAIAGASTFVVAYAVHKVFAPVRIGMTLTCTPFIVRYLRKVGFLKEPKA